MKIIEVNEGPKIAYKQTGTVISFADGELALNCAAYQRDWGVHLDICENKDGNLVIGTESGLNYVAQLDIPEREYIYPEPDETVVADADIDPDDDAGEMGGTNNHETEPPIPVPLDMKKVTLSLWAIA